MRSSSTTARKTAPTRRGSSSSSSSRRSCAKSGSPEPLEPLFELLERAENSLRERGIRLDRVEQDVHRNLGADRERELAEPLAGLRPDGDGADENASRPIRRELHEAGPARALVGREATARDLVPRRHDAVALHAADVRDLRIREHGSRYRAVVGANVGASKLVKAEKLGTKQIDEQVLVKMLES